jgi:hypothetical protein
LCWFACISYLYKKRKDNENSRTRVIYAKQFFFDYYGLENGSEEEQKKAIEYYEGFNILSEIYHFVEFFEVTLNIFIYSKKNNYYEKFCTYFHDKPKFYLNVGLLNFPTYQHAVWLKNVEKAVDCYTCPKCQVSIFYNYGGYNAHIQDCNGKKMRESVLLVMMKQLIKILLIIK